MNILTNVGMLSPVGDVKVRLRDTRTGEAVGSQGFVSGGGMQGREYIFEFNNVCEFNEFVDILLLAKKQLTIQDAYLYSNNSGLCDSAGNPTFGEDLDYLFNEVENGRIPSGRATESI